jgi:plasmid stabilization system protein ParE
VRRWPARFQKSLETEVDPEAEAAWQSEVQTRLRELDERTTATIPWSEVRARLMAALSAETVRYHPEAVAEAVASADWYAERSPIAAEAFVREIENGVQEVSNAPSRWPSFVSGTRRFLLRRSH